MSASFRVNGTHSANCTAQTTTLRRTSNISSTSTWSSVGLGTPNLGSRTEYHSNSCGNTGYREFNAIVGAQYIAHYNQSWLDMALIVSEASITYWKRFRANATLSITYNRPPAVPTSLQLINPSVTTCITGPDRPVIASTTPTLTAISTDPDGGSVQTRFNVATVGNEASPFWTSDYQAPMTSGSRASAPAPSTGIEDGGVYAWNAQATDGSKTSDPSGWCEFAVDTSMPAGPTVTPVESDVAAIYVEDGERGGVGQLGKFTIDRGSETDVVLFKYSFAGATLTEEEEPGLDGTAVIEFAPTTAGPVTLTVKSFDAAGNPSASTIYTFRVATPTEDAVWTLDDGEGDTADDSVGGPARPFDIHGAAWGEGPHGLFDSRVGDHALVFDGENDDALTDGPVIDTVQSFAVSAHVKLDADALTGSQSFTALSQDGVTESGFQVGYAATCTDMPDGCWQFSMPDSIAGPGVTAVHSEVPVTAGEWTHLVAEYDATAHEMSLWTCEIGTPEDPAIGEPVESVAARSATPWAASGAFVLGRAMAGGVETQFWPGSIDNVRVFSGEIVSPAKIRRLCQGAEATDFSGGATALDPTTTAGE